MSAVALAALSLPLQVLISASVGVAVSQHGDETPVELG
jgi:hypothetical protein